MEISLENGASLWYPELKLNTSKALTGRSTFFLMRREGAAGASSREGSLEGSPRAVDRTDMVVLVGSNGVSTVIGKAVSDGA